MVIKVPKFKRAAIDFGILREGGLSEDVLFVSQIAIEAAYLAIWARRRWMYWNRWFTWRKKDGSPCTLGDKLVTHYLVSRLKQKFHKGKSSRLFCLTEENLSRYAKCKDFCGNEKNFRDFFLAQFGASIDGIDGTHFYALGKSFSIWFGLAKLGVPWCSFFVEVGPDMEGILEIVVAEAGRGAWHLKPESEWFKLAPIKWDKQVRPLIAHGLPLSHNSSFRGFDDFLSGPNFFGHVPDRVETVPIGRAVVDVISGKRQLYSHALLPSWDWFNCQLLVAETGYHQQWYSIDERGVPHFFDGYPRPEHYSPHARLCLNFGIEEFVGIAKNFLLRQAGKQFFHPG